VQLRLRLRLRLCPSHRQRRLDGVCRRQLRLLLGHQHLGGRLLQLHLHPVLDHPLALLREAQLRFLHRPRRRRRRRDGLHSRVQLQEKLVCAGVQHVELPQRSLRRAAILGNLPQLGQEMAVVPEQVGVDCRRVLVAGLLLQMGEEMLLVEVAEDPGALR
jgi:hypothetical protein